MGRYPTTYCSDADGIFPFSLFYGYDDAHGIEAVRIENLRVHGRKISRLADARLSMGFAKDVVVY